MSANETENLDVCAENVDLMMLAILAQMARKINDLSNLIIELDKQVSGVSDLWEDDSYDDYLNTITDFEFSTGR